MKLLRLITAVWVVMLSVQGIEAKSKGEVSEPQEPKAGKNYSGKYVSEFYEKRDQGYDWTAVYVKHITENKIEVSIRSRPDRERPTCSAFDAIAEKINETTFQTILYSSGGGTVLFEFKDSLIDIHTKDFDNRFLLMRYCNGGGSLMGDYKKTDDTTNELQSDKKRPYDYKYGRFKNFDAGLFGGLYLVGWSEDESYFAWFRYNLNTGAADPPEGLFFRLHIQDVRSDQIVYTKNVSGIEVCGNQDCPFDLDFIWEKCKKEFVQQFKKYKITINDSMGIKIKKSPFTVKNNDVYSVSSLLQKNYSDSIYYEGYDKILYSEKIVVNSFRWGSKVVYEKTHKNLPLAEHSEIAGIIISPSEKRSLIIKKTKYLDYADSGDFALAELIGCHLSSGYK